MPNPFRATFALLCGVVGAVGGVLVASWYWQITLERRDSLLLASISMNDPSNGLKLADTFLAEDRITPDTYNHFVLTALSGDQRSQLAARESLVRLSQSGFKSDLKRLQESLSSLPVHFTLIVDDNDETRERADALGRELADRETLSYRLIVSFDKVKVNRLICYNQVVCDGVARRVVDFLQLQGVNVELSPKIFGDGTGSASKNIDLTLTKSANSENKPLGPHPRPGNHLMNEPDNKKNR